MKTSDNKPASSQSPARTTPGKYFNIAQFEWEKLGPDLFYARAWQTLRAGFTEAQVLRLASRKYLLDLYRPDDLSENMDYRVSLQNEGVLAAMTGLVKRRGDGYPTSYASPSDPVGFFMRQGEILHPPVDDDLSFAQDRSGRVLMEKFGSRGLRLLVGDSLFVGKEWNQPRLDSVGLSFYDASFGERTPPAAISFAVYGGRIVQCIRSGGVEIPHGGFAVAMNPPEGLKEAGVAIVVGAGARIESPEKWRMGPLRTILTAGAPLMAGGKYVPIPEIATKMETDQADKPAMPTRRISKGAIGLTADYQIVISILRLDDAPLKNPPPLKILARLMKDVGCIGVLSSAGEECAWALPPCDLAEDRSAGTTRALRRTPHPAEGPIIAVSRKAKSD